MSHANPTALRIGMSGTLDGRKYTVLGRVVYGVRIESETYYWHEFHLGDPTGEMATLVFEEMETGPTWKFFRQFKPAAPFSARDAAAKRLGEGLNLTGQPARVTLIGVSQVYEIEGAAPPGTELGEVDNYFNAETGKRMVVVCWRGDKVEFYEGRNLPRGTAEALFGLPPPRESWSKALFGGMADWDWDQIKPVAIGILIVGFLVLTQTDLSYDPGVFHPDPPPKLAAPEPRLPMGAQGSLAGKHYKIIGCALAEVAQVGRRFDRREYLLADDAGGQMLLIQGLRGGADWHLFKMGATASIQAVYDSAAVRSGGTVSMGQRKWPVTHLFMETARKLEGQPLLAMWPANTLYGYVAGAGDDWLMLRWTETNLWVGFEGHAVGQKEVVSALGQAP